MPRWMVDLVLGEPAPALQPPVTDEAAAALAQRNAVRVAAARARILRARDEAVDWPQPGVHWSLQHPNQ